MTRWLALLLFAAPLSAAQTADALLDRLAAAEERAKTLRLSFTQTTEVKLTKETTAMSGTAAFRRPDKFRLEHKAPRALTAVSDGQKLWLYIPARNQVMVDTWENWSRSAGFPLGLSPFQRKAAEFRAKYDIALQGEDTLKLTSRDGGAWAHTLLVTIDAAGIPVRTVLESQGVKSVTQVSAVEMNPALPDDFFTFTPPKGADVLNVPSRQGPQK